MSLAPFLQLVSEVLKVDRRDFYMLDPTLLNPVAANPLIDGEWLAIDSAYKAIRGSGNSSVPTFQVFAERGRYDTQAIGKVPLLFLGGYEAETTVVDLSGLSVNDKLIVGDVTIGGLTRRGLKKIPSGSGTYGVVGTVTRLPGSGKVRYIIPAAGMVIPVVVP